MQLPKLLKLLARAMLNRSGFTELLPFVADIERDIVHITRKKAAVTREEVKGHVMINHIAITLIALAIVWNEGQTTASASPHDSFLNFPPSCAQQAFDQLPNDRANPSSLARVVRDLNGTWDSRVNEVYSVYGDLLAPSFELLDRAAHNQKNHEYLPSNLSG